MSATQQNVVAVGLDGSEASLAATRWAAREAARRGLVLRLVHAVAPSPGARRGRRAPEQQPEAALRIMDSARGDLGLRHPELPLEEDLVTEEPEKALVRTASETRMLVLGTRGLHRLPSFFLGSTSLATVARADHPVVLVRATQGPQEEETGPGPEPEEAAGGGRVVVALSLGHTYENVLRFAFDTAAASGLPIHVVHAIRLPSHVYVPGGPVVPHIAVEFRKEREQEVRDKLRPWVERFPQVRVGAALRLETAAEAVVHEVEAPDLLVVGRCRKHRVALGPRIGPVAQAAVHHAACPVAVVPHD